MQLPRDKVDHLNSILKALEDCRSALYSVNIKDDKHLLIRGWGRVHSSSCFGACRLSSSFHKQMDRFTDAPV